MYKFTILDIPTNVEEAENFCREKGLLPRNFHCPTHTENSMKYYRGKGHGRFRCTRNKCNKEISGRKNSFFEDTKLEIPVGLGIMISYAWDYPYDQTDSLIQAVRRKSGSPAVGLSSATIAAWFRYCREMVVDYFNNLVVNLAPIGGPGRIVQIDESLFGHRKYKRGRILQGSWVLGMIDDEDNVRMVVVQQRDTPTIHAEILKYVAPGSIIHTDSWRAYNGLEDLPVDPPFVHMKVNHNDPEHHFVVADGKHTQKIEATRRPAKDFFRGRSRFCDHNFADRLCEYLWRRHCRKNEIDVFEFTLEAVRASYPL